MQNEIAKFPETLKPQDWDKAWAIFCEIRQFEQHFNNLQSGYRTLASTWLLAMFIAVGFVLSRPVDFLLPHLVVVMLIGGVCSIGIWLLWCIDILVYQRLLGAAFTEGVRLEEHCPCLPQVRRNMMLSQPGGSVRFRIIWFYMVSASVPLLISDIALVIWLAERHNPGAVLVLAGVGALAIVLGLAFRMHRLSVVKP